LTITNGYCTLAEVKLRVWPTDAAANSTEDTLLEDMVMAASRTIDNDTSRRFFTTSSDETRTYQATSFDSLCFIDILSVTSLKTDDDGDGVYETTWATTDFFLAPFTAALDGKPYTVIHTTPNGSYTFPVGAYAGVQVVGKFGYSSTAPKDIKEAVLVRCLIEYQGKNAFGGMGKPQETLEQLESLYKKLITPFVRYV